ncbi:flagellar hook-length control protein FliK [Massilia horti]|uniref:Flagellar hook-length control protein FliK n=1 Tax=Massilia horti TaxID=2562153 RepID=A0A4Y9T2G4_9BURK|nr:flagellar hook-length control protein FliK [Massilia horti]TFW32088.1 flagellar hook-length control protein FliK [Massilia horti]
MDTPTLPIRATTGISPQLENTAVPGDSDAGQFSAALAREVAQRQEASAPPPADKPAAPAASASEPAKPVRAAPDDSTGKTANASDAGEDDDGTEHPIAAQVTDMLALVASLNLPPQANPAAPASQPAETPLPAHGTTDAIPGTVAKGLGTKGTGKDGAPMAGRAFDAAARSHNPAKATVTPAVEHKGPAKEGFDLRTGAEALPDKFKVQPTMTQAAQERAAVEAAAHQELAPIATTLAQVAPLAAQAAGVAADHLPARVGSAAWDQQVGQKIVWMVAGEEQSASLTLNPPDLGPLKVVLSVTNDQASVAFSANQLEVRQALENALPRLREMMSESGIALGNATVDAGMPDQRQAQDDGSRAGGGAGTRHDDAAGTPDSAPPTVTRVTTLGPRGAVDTFA